MHTRSPWKRAYSPWKHEVSHCESVPSAMVKEPVSPSSIVDEDHYHQRHPEQVKGEEKGGEGRRRGRGKGSHDDAKQQMETSIALITYISTDIHTYIIPPHISMQCHNLYTYVYIHTYIIIYAYIRIYILYVCSRYTHTRQVDV